MRQRSFGILSLLLFALVVGSGPSQAQSKRASQLYRQGKQLAQQKRYPDAIQKYQAALKILEGQYQSGSPAKKKRLQRSISTLLYIIGRTHQFAGQPQVARKYYRRCLLYKPSTKVELLVRRYLQELNAKLGLPLGNLSQLTIDVSPRHASISLVGPTGAGRFGRVPFSVRVKPGSYKLEIAAAGFQTFRTTLELKAGQRLNRRFSLARAGAKPPPACKAKQKRKCPCKDGSKGLQLCVEGSWSTCRCKAAPPKPKPLNVRQALLWTGLGLGTLTFFVGVVLGGLSAGAHSDAREIQVQAVLPNSAPDKRFYALAEQGNAYFATSMVFLVLAAATGGAVAYFWLQPPKKAKRKPAL